MKSTFKISVIFFILITFFSCTKDVDFNQLDDAEINTSYILTLAYFKLYALDLLDSNNNEELSQVEVVQASLADVSQEYLEKVELTFETTNIFNREFNVQVVFFDANQNPIYELDPVLIPANSAALETIIEIPFEDLHYIFETEYFAFFIVLFPSEDGSVITPSDDSYVEFKSSVELFLKYSTI